ncbi:hypothetical protein GUJ93_ZPchr0012g19387 [Zizania palustris]|uniref:AAA+ ATPase domain-containing protein n=1 Tax=Zizania palustris TaxID=103762 RepID=A0A8J6BX79_ZIZPA|nr:hypothetical protein GUJ93_ZPchr0012g19387 [Zizania palustris]
MTTNGVSADEHEREQQLQLQRRRRREDEEGDDTGQIELVGDEQLADGSDDDNELEGQLPPSTTSVRDVVAGCFRESLFFSSAEQQLQGAADDEAELKWAAIERLPTYDRLRTSLLSAARGGGGGDAKGAAAAPPSAFQVVDVRRLRAAQRRAVVQSLVADVKHDNIRLLRKQRERMERVNVRPPTVEVRWRDVCVEAECQVVAGKPLPTLWNSALSKFSLLAATLGFSRHRAKISILKNVTGIIKPSRITLLLGPPGCGKTTLLKALAGRLNKSLTVTGEIEYNGVKLDEFVPEKTSAYVSQYNLHVPEMTVRETLDFSARFQGVGSRAEIMKEVIRREKEAGITPDPDVDTYMKAVSMEGLERSMQTDYIMKIMGLDRCANIIVGDAMRRGISGGEMKRLTTGEMIVGPCKVLLMDEISTGLDSSTTFQIVSCLQQLAHITERKNCISWLKVFRYELL